MQLQNQRLIVSATDLVGFLECDHLVTLELAAARGDLAKPFRDDPELDLIRRRGFAHEQAYLARLRSDGRSVREIETGEIRTVDELRAAEAATVAAMRDGADVIFQATFFDGRWRGHADFLLRRDDRPSDLGSWSYDVADTKLAKRVKAAAIVQMCVYSDLLARIQGIPPETVSVVTGDGMAHAHRLADYSAYYRAAKGRFEDRIFGPAGEARADDGSAAADEATYPEPVDHCRVCTWWPTCVDRRRADDHLSLVAGLARNHRRRLVEADVATLAALGELDPERAVRGVPSRILERVRHQAALQLGYRRTGELAYELVPPDAERLGIGLAGLPEPSPLDVFFDIEADPWALEDGLEYLLGWTEVTPDGPAYHAIWAHDRDEEKAAFEAFVDLVLERHALDPGMHVYHYGGYESGALKRLMQRHATREDEVDRLLRGNILTNLYDHVVRPGVRASVESYSLKQIEKFYLPAREGPITQAGFSVVEYERWMASREPAILDSIADYNRDDCLSTLLLRDWLERLRAEAAPLFPDGVVPRPVAADPEPSEAVKADQVETQAREVALRAGIGADRTIWTEDQAGRWLLAALIDWHRREAKPAWWTWFDLARAPMEQLVASPEALGELDYVGEVGTVARSVIDRYRFDPAQEAKIKPGNQPIDPTGGGGDRHAGAGTVVAFDPVAGTIDLRRNRARPHPRGLIPGQPYGSEPMRGSLGRLADHVIEHGIDGPGRFRAARDLILRRPPRIARRAGDDPADEASLVRPGEKASDAARRLAVRLDGTVLAIQGPPGTGKTWTGARMVLDLVAEGRRVGVTAQSHKVIANLLEAIVRAAAEAGADVRVGQRVDAEDPAADDRVARIGSNEVALAGLADGTFQVVGGTSWLWARLEMEGAVDVLFVDEAGQVSLATVCAVAAAADSVVLLGDPNQLPQVSQGTHPDGAGASALEHLIGGAKTIPPDRGLFLGTTYRLHPEVNAYVSDAFYEGRLATDAANAVQGLAGGERPLSGTGIRFVPIEQAGAGNRSREEATWIAEAIERLVGRDWTDREGAHRRLEAADVLVVAPYNAQVAEIAAAVHARLGVRPNVGTVDKFQGREAPVAIYSMTTSSPDEAPRDLEFLYSGNRLNVAISRARGLAILVASPELLRVACRTPEQMRLVNALCRLVEVAREQARLATPPAGLEPAADAAAEGASPDREERYEILDLGLA